MVLKDSNCERLFHFDRNCKWFSVKCNTEKWISFVSFQTKEISKTDQKGLERYLFAGLSITLSQDLTQTLPSSLHSFNHFSIISQSLFNLKKKNPL
jgi:hypothetical protein